MRLYRPAVLRTAAPLPLPVPVSGMVWLGVVGVAVRALARLFGWGVRVSPSSPVKYANGVMKTVEKGHHLPTL